MIRQTAIALVLAATAVLTPVSAFAETPANTARTNQRIADQNRVTFNLYNSTIMAGTVLVDGKEYPVDKHHMLTITAPVGTVVYAQKNIPFRAKGDAILTVTADMRNRSARIN